MGAKDLKNLFKESNLEESKEVHKLKLKLLTLLEDKEQVKKLAQLVEKQIQNSKK